MTRGFFPILRSIFLFTALILFAAGCGTNSTTAGNEGTGGISAKLTWGGNDSKSQAKTVAMPATVVKVRIIVSGTGMTDIQKDFTAANGSGVIDAIPSGSGRSLKVQGIDANNYITFQGEATNITVQTGQVTDVWIVAVGVTPFPAATPLLVLPATITVGTSAATAVNSGDFNAGTTTITFPFTRAVKATAYTANTSAVNSVIDDVVIFMTAKAGNIPYTVAFTADMKALTVSFITSPSMIYSLSVSKVLAKIQDSDGAWYNGAVAAPVLPVTLDFIRFSTISAPTVGAISATPFSRVTGSIAGDSTITLTPVANSIGAFVYVQKMVNGIVVVDWTAFTEGATNTKKVMPYGTAINLAAANPGAGTGNAFTTAGLGAFQGVNVGITAFAVATPYYIGVDKVSYNVKAAYVNADKIELAANTTGLFLVDDKTRPTVTAVTTDDVALGAVAGAPYGTVILPASRATSSKTEADATLRNLPVFNGINTADSVSAGGTAAVTASFSGQLYSKAGAVNTDKFLARVWFDDQMIPGLVTDGTKWGITDTALAASATANPYLTVTGASTNGGVYAGNCGAVACRATISFNGTPTVTYDSVLRMATISYRLNWAFTQPGGSVGGVLGNTTSEIAAANIGTGSVYAITSVGNLPNFRFTLAGTDLNGNTIDNGLYKGF